MLSWSTSPVKYRIKVPAHAQEMFRIEIGPDEGTTSINNTSIIQEIGANWAKIAIEIGGTKVETTAEVDAATWLTQEGDIGEILDIFNLGSNDDGDAGLTPYGDPQDNVDGTAYIFDGNDGLDLGTDLDDSSNLEFLVIAKISSKSGPGTLVKDGGNNYGVAVGIDSGGNLGIFGRNGGSLTSITVPAANYDTDVYYRIWATKSKVVVQDYNTEVVVSEASGTCNPGNGSAYFSIGYASWQSPISGSSSSNIDFIQAEIDSVQIFATGELSPPSTPYGEIYLPGSLLSPTEETILFLYADASQADNPNITDVGTPPGSYWDAADLVTWSVITRHEEEYSFYISIFIEEFYQYSALRAIKYEDALNYTIKHAVRYENEYKYDVVPSGRYEQEYKFDISAYKAYEDMYLYGIKAGHVFSEDEFQFVVDFRANALYEELYRFWTGGLVLSSAVQAGLSVIVDNVLIEAISVSGGRNGYYDLFRAVIPDDQAFRSLPVGAAASLTWHSAKLEGDTSTPVVDKSFSLFYKQASTSISASEHGDIKTATIDLVSHTAQLDRLPSPIYGSNPVSEKWAAGTMASSVLDALCLPYLTYTLDYPDFPLLQDLDGGDRYPIEIINELFPLAWIGPDEAGELLIKRKLAHSPAEMLEDGFVHDIDLPDSEYIIDVNTDYPSIPLYNQVTVATIAESDAVIFPAPEIIENEDDRNRAVVYGYRYPWFVFDLITCNTECGNIVISAGKEEIVEVIEYLDFEEGEATFPLPIYEFVSVDWDCNVSLGTITASGDGQLKAAVDGWSYGAVTCKVRRMVFNLTAYNRDEDLKFRLRDQE